MIEVLIVAAAVSAVGGGVYLYQRGKPSNPKPQRGKPPNSKLPKAVKKVTATVIS